MTDENDDLGGPGVPSEVGNATADQQTPDRNSRAEKTLTTKGEELIERLRRRAANRRQDIVHATDEADGWFATMPPNTLEEWRFDAEEFEQTADALQALIDKENKELESARESDDRLCGAPEEPSAGKYKALPPSENERNAAFRAAVAHLPDFPGDGWVWTNKELDILRKAGFSRHAETIRTETLMRVAATGIRMWLGRQQNVERSDQTTASESSRALPTLPVDVSGDREGAAQVQTIGPEIATDKDSAESSGPTRAATFQERVGPWMIACFGHVIPFDKEERGDRLLEEVFELLQSGGYDPARVVPLRDYTWNRPVGEPAQELGGVMVTVAAYSNAFDLDMHKAGETELARIWTKVDLIRAKQAAKPTGSALPVCVSSSEQDRPTTGSTPGRSDLTGAELPHHPS
jgi:hypothetical protein